MASIGDRDFIRRRICPPLPVIPGSAVRIISKPRTSDGTTGSRGPHWGFRAVFPGQTPPNLIDFWAVFYLKIGAKFEGRRSNYEGIHQGYSFSQNFFQTMHPTMAATPMLWQSNALNQ